MFIWDWGLKGLLHFHGRNTDHPGSLLRDQPCYLRHYRVNTGEASGVILRVLACPGKAPVPYKHGSSRRSPVHAGDDLGSYGISPIHIIHAGSRRGDTGRDPCRRLGHPWRSLELRGRPGGQHDSFWRSKTSGVIRGPPKNCPVGLPDVHRAPRMPKASTRISPRITPA